MRRRLIGLWCCATVLIAVVHYVIGRRLIALDRAADFVVAAQASAARDDWAAAERDYRQAADAMPQGDADRPARLRLQLAVEHARVRNGQIVDALDQMKRLLTEAERNVPNDHAFIDAFRGELAGTRYYTAWLMRRQGASAIDSCALAESARQDFRYLAGRSPQTPAAQDNMRRVIAFEQADDETIQAQPFPEPALASNQDVAQRYDEQQRQQSNPDGQGEDSRNQLNLNQPNDGASRPQNRTRSGS